MTASVFSSGQWWTAIAVAAVLLIGTAFLRVIVNPVVKQNRQLRSDDAEACVLVAHRHPSTDEVVDFLGSSAPRRVLGEPLPMYFSVVADDAGLRLLSPRDGGSPHLTVPWAEVRGIARGFVAIRGGTVAALNITVERASRSYELQLVIGSRHVWGTYPLGAGGIDQLVDTLRVLQPTQD